MNDPRTLRHLTQTDPAARSHIDEITIRPIEHGGEADRRTADERRFVRAFVAASASEQRVILYLLRRDDGSGRQQAMRAIVAQAMARARAKPKAKRKRKMKQKSPR